MAKAESVTGYFVNTKGDTIRAEFRMAESWAGFLKVKKIRRSIKYSVQGGNLKTLYPSEVQYIRVTDTSFGDYEIYPLKIEKKWIFALCVVNGNMQLFKSEKDNAAWILNRYSSPTEVIHYIKVKDRPLACSNRTPFNKTFWVQYLGKEYFDYTECLNWGGKKRRQMRRAGTPCSWEGKTLVEIVKSFNEKYP